MYRMVVAAAMALAMLWGIPARGGEMIERLKAHRMAMGVGMEWRSPSPGVEVFGEVRTFQRPISPHIRGWYYAGQVLDLVSTYRGLRHGCSEANPLSIGHLNANETAAVKIAGMVTIERLATKWVRKGKISTEMGEGILGVGGILGFAAGFSNGTRDCVGWW